jgi:hypothetical protein
MTGGRLCNLVLLIGSHGSRGGGGVVIGWTNVHFYAGSSHAPHFPTPL